MSIDPDLHHRLQDFVGDLDRTAARQLANADRSARSNNVVLASQRRRPSRTARWSALVSAVVLGIGSLSVVRTFSQPRIVGFLPVGVTPAQITDFEYLGQATVMQELHEIDGQDALMSRYDIALDRNDTFDHTGTQRAPSAPPQWVNGIAVTQRNEGKTTIYRFNAPNTVEVRMARSTTGETSDTTVQRVIAMAAGQTQSAPLLARWKEGSRLAVKWAANGKTNALLAVEGSPPDRYTTRVAKLSYPLLATPLLESSGSDTSGWQIYATNVAEQTRSITSSEAARLVTELDERWSVADGSAEIIRLDDNTTLRYDVGPQVSLCLNVRSSKPVCALRYTGIVSRRIGSDWWLFGVGADAMTVSAVGSSGKITELPIKTVVFSRVPDRVASAVLVPATVSRVRASVIPLGQYTRTEPETLIKEYRRPTW
jgi:hypothetical protein